MVLVSSAVSVGYYFAVMVGFALTSAQQPIASFWPPLAVLIAALVLTPRRTWWIFLLMVSPAHILGQMRAGVPAAVSFASLIGNMGGALLGAVCITTFSNCQSLFQTVRGVNVFLVFGVIVAPLLTSLADAAVAKAMWPAVSYWLLWKTWLFATVLAELTLAPTIITLGSKRFLSLASKNLHRDIEAIVLWCAIALTSVVVFERMPIQHSIAALIYLPLPLLLWTTLRLGVGGLSSSFLAISLIALSSALHGRGPFASSSMALNVPFLQVLLCALAVPLILLAAGMTERQSVEDSLRHTQSIYHRQLLLEQSLSGISKRLAFNYAEGLEDEIEKTFHIVLEVTGAERIVWYRRGRSTLIRQYSSAARDSQPSPMVVAFDQIPYTAGRLVLGETVILHRLQDLPPCEKLDRTFFKGVLGNPLLLLPSTCGTTTSGVLAVVFPANSGLINDFLSQFAVLADILAAALERRSVEAVKTDYQQRFEGLVMQAPVGIALENLDRQILFANPNLCSILGYSEAELLGKNDCQLGIEDSSQNLALFEKLCSRLISQYQLDKRFKRKDGEIIWAHQTVSLLRTDSGSPPVVIVMLHDITNRKTLETQLQECDAELQRLSAGLIQGQETERRHLSQELHDDIGQRLSFLLISLSQIGQELPAEMTAAHAQLSELLQQAEELATAVHELSHQLHSSILQHLGLVAALEGLSHRAERQYHIAVDLQTHDIPVISYDAALCLFRVAQEALNNAVKHGKAPEVTIRLEENERRLRLEVRDSGVGFETDKRGPGLGLLTMRERLRLLGGELAVQSSPGEGTRVIGSLPLSTEESSSRT